MYSDDFGEFLVVAANSAGHSSLGCWVREVPWELSGEKDTLLVQQGGEGKAGYGVPAWGDQAPGGLEGALACLLQVTETDSVKPEMHYVGNPPS